MALVQQSSNPSNNLKNPSSNPNDPSSNPNNPNNRTVGFPSPRTYTPHVPHSPRYGGAAKAQLLSRPQVYVSGEVECAAVCGTQLRNMYCTWSFRFARTQWWLLKGQETGETFHSDCSETGMCSWNHPFAAHFAAISLEGWPRLELVVRGKDCHGRNQLGGYGSIIIPTTPGVHEMIVQCWKPYRGSGEGFFSSLFGGSDALLGITPEFAEGQLHSNVSEPNKTKVGIKSENSVEVLIRFNVVLQDFKGNGLSV